MTHVRWMIRRDMAEVLAMEREAHGEKAKDEEYFLHCLRQRNCIGMVAEEGDRTVGYVLYELHKTKLGILNFAVAADRQRQGIGTAMLDKLKGTLSSHHRNRLELLIGERNLSALRFLKAQGFLALSVLRNWEENEDAYLMAYDLVAANSPTEGTPDPQAVNNRLAQYFARPAKDLPQWEDYQC